MQRKRFLERIKDRISRGEGLIERAEYYRTLFYTFDRHLSSEDTKNDHPLVRINKRQPMYDMTEEALDGIRRFQRSEKEGKSLLAELLEWIVGEITRPYHSALHEQEMRQPKLIYGVEDRTEEIPFE